MSKTTTNLKLIKPELTDAADITTYNSNWDTLDNEFRRLDDDLYDTNQKITVIEQTIDREVDTLDDEIQALAQQTEDDLNDLETSVTTINKNISTLEQNIDEVNDTIKDMCLYEHNIKMSRNVDQEDNYDVYFKVMRTTNTKFENETSSNNQTPLWDVASHGYFPAFGQVMGYGSVVGIEFNDTRGDITIYYHNPSHSLGMVNTVEGNITTKSVRKLSFV